MYLKKWKLWISALLIAFAILVPPFTLDLDVPTLLTVLSFLFAILVGFFIATATTNYLRLQALVAEEDAGLITIFNLVRNIAPEQIDKMTEALDAYMIASLSFELTDYVNKTSSEFENLGRAVDEVSFIDKKGEQLIGSLHDKKNGLYQTRQEIVLVAHRIVTPGHWIVLISLAALVGLLTLTLRDGGILSASISGILLATNYLVLTLLYEVDANRFLEHALYEDSQQVFRSIGRPPYYLEDAIKNGRLEEPKTSYRTGYYKSYNDKEIKLVERG